MELLQVGPQPATAPWEAGVAIAGATTAAVPASPSSGSVLGMPLRCRFGRHRWLSLAMSVNGACRPLGLSFCRDCDAIRRPGSR